MSLGGGCVDDNTPPSRETVALGENATPVSGDATYTTGQAARALGVSISGVRKMIASGELVANRDERGHHRIPWSAVRAKLEERRFSPPSEPSELGAEPRDSGLRGEEIAVMRRELQQLREEVAALREELGPLARLLRHTEEDKVSALKEKGALEKEREGLLVQLEQERRRANELAQELDDLQLKWWAQWFESKSGHSQGV
jgi:excisionase family DNA binding protein